MLKELILLWKELPQQIFSLKLNFMKKIQRRNLKLTVLESAKTNMPFCLYFSYFMAFSLCMSLPSPYFLKPFYKKDYS